MKNIPIDCLGVVLAGGLSSRMGKDKSKLSRAKSNNMLDFSKQLLIDVGIKNIIVSGDNHEVPDLVPQSGPVGGIYSVLTHYPEHLQPKSLLILPVDLPLMTATELSKLRVKGELSNKATFFQGADNRAHHIPLYIPNNAYLSLYFSQVFNGKCLLSLAKSTNTIDPSSTMKRGPSVRSMLEKVPHQAIKCTSTNALFNTNTPEEWQQAKTKF